MSAPLKPFTVREGHVTLRVWPAPGVVRGRVYPAWEFEYVDPQHGRQRVKRARRADIEARAREIAQRLARGEFTVKGRQAADYSEADLIAARWNVTVAEMARHYDRARQAQAAQPRSTKTTGELIAEFIAWQRSEGHSRVHIDDLDQRLKRFAQQVQHPLADLTADALKTWLESLPVSRRTRRNYRGAIANLVNWCRTRGHLPKTFDVLDAVPVGNKRRQRDVREIVFTPREMRLLIQHIRPSALPALLIGGFAGARASEIRKLQWSDILWEDNLITIPVGTKTGRRLAPLLPNLRAWLEPLRGEGRVVKLSKAGINDAFAEAVRSANAALAAAGDAFRMNWRQNAPRHSFVSYRCAATRNLPLVSDECGHSVRVLQTEYRETVTPRAASEWFGIVPGASAKVLFLPLGAAEPSPKTPPKASPIAGTA